MKLPPLCPRRRYALPLLLLLTVSVLLPKCSFAARRWTRAAALSAIPTSVSFGGVLVGTHQTQYESLTNKSSGSLTIYSASVTGSGFNVSGLTVPLTLSPGQSVTCTLVFAPQTTGTMSGSLSIKAKYWSSGVSVPLSGTGTSPGQLGVAPGSLNFGNVTVGSSSSLSSTLTASGSSVTISSVTTTSPEFSLSGFSLPLTIAAGQSIPFSVNFSPKSSGTASGALAFVGTSASPSQTVSGTGIAPSHSVTLSWGDASTGISGYNLYRGGASGGPYTRINSSLDPSTGYVDTSVAAGQSYYYVTTAVDTNGVESGYSNQVQAVIPSP